MRLELIGTVVGNGPGIQTYFGERFADTPAFPFDPGDEFRALCVPTADAIVLVDADRDLDFPLDLTIHDPESYRLTIDPPPSEPMHTTTEETDLDRSNPRGDAER